MKRLLMAGLLVLTLVRLAPAAPSQTFQNDGQLVSPPATPPNIDALNFVNNGLFDIEFNGISTAINSSLVGVVFFSSQLAPFEFSDVLNYTNRGRMACDTGFTFDNSPSTSGFRRMASTFGNANTGSIVAGSVTNDFLSQLVFFLGTGNFLTGVPTVNVLATNVVNTGLISCGSGGFLNMKGDNVNLVRGTMHVEGFDETNIVDNVGSIGIQDNYWGIGKQTNQISPFSLQLPFPFSPFSSVTNNTGLPTFAEVAPPIATAFANVQFDGPSNRCVQVVYINTNLPGISTDVRFDTNRGSAEFALPVIQWKAIITNNLGVQGLSLTTNFLYLSDQFGSFPTNFLITNGFTFSGVSQPQPYNYSFQRSFPGYDFLPTGNTPFDEPFLFQNPDSRSAFPQTNAYAAYGVNVSPVSSFPDPTLPGSTVTNTPGRIQIVANKVLDLTKAKVTGPNYLNLTSTNHFVGSTSAQIISPFMDVNLGSTNGSLTISNLVAPYVPRFTGPVDMWSGRWTNVVNGFTNTFHVLIVNAQLAPTALPLLLSCSLRSTNIAISDALEIDQSLLINAKSLTITSNDSFAAKPYGQLNFLSPDIVWSSSLPVMQSLTNFGLISVLNSSYFYGVRQTPYYPTSFTEPYLSLVNHGFISTAGNLIWAQNFENTGGGLIITNSFNVTTTSNHSALIYSSVGPITLTANTALFINGAFDAPGGDINIGVGSLTISNHDLITSGALTLTVTNALTDTGILSSNGWSIGDGINLLMKPASGDLLGTTVTNICPAGLEVIDTWAGTDLGPSPAGYVDNAALGRLILDGGSQGSQFYFGGPDSSQHYALYVDQIELRNGATNEYPINGTQNFIAFDIADNMTIYFADAVIGQFDISEKLNGANNGHLVWVPTYAGANSSTNIVISGVTNTYNRALTQSTDIDSNGNGTANAFDPNPFYNATSLNLQSAVTNQPVKSPLIQWFGLSHATNLLYYSTSPMSANWTQVSNMVLISTNGGVYKYYTTNVSGLAASNSIILPASGTISVNDRVRTNGGYYKVQVKLPKQ